MVSKYLANGQVLGHYFVHYVMTVLHGDSSKIIGSSLAFAEHIFVKFDFLHGLLLQLLNFKHKYV